MPREIAAQTIEAIAERIANGERSNDLSAAITAAEQAMLDIEHIEGMRLLNRIGLLMVTNSGTENIHYPIVRKIVDNLKPLDASADSAALRALAYELRTQG